MSVFCSPVRCSLSSCAVTFNCFVFSLRSEEKTEQLLDCKQELEQMEAELKRLQQEVWALEIQCLQRAGKKVATNDSSNTIHSDFVWLSLYFGSVC